MTRYLVTVRLDESRTRDHSIEARSAYNAGWLYRQLHPQARIIAIRLAHKTPPSQQAAAS